MKKEEIEVVYNAIKLFGDGFWTEFPVCLDEDNALISNMYLFDDILEFVNEAGYDLKLVKLET